MPSVGSQLLLMTQESKILWDPPTVFRGKMREKKMVHHKLAIYITSDRCHDRRNLLALIQEKKLSGCRIGKTRSKFTPSFRRKSSALQNDNPSNIKPKLWFFDLEWNIKLSKNIDSSNNLFCWKKNSPLPLFSSYLAQKIIFLWKLFIKFV